MTLTVTHTKTVSIADDPKAAAAGEVLPSDWNADHTIVGADTIPILATSNLTFNVTTTGNDTTGDGSSGNPFATVQHAATVAAGYDYQSLYFPTIQIGDGSYAQSGINLPPIPSAGNVPTVQGNLTDRTKVTLVVPASEGFTVFLVEPQAIWRIKNFSIDMSATDGISCYMVGFYAVGLINCGDVIFGNNTTFLDAATYGVGSIFAFGAVSGNSHNISSSGGQAISTFISASGSLVTYNAVSTVTNALTAGAWLDATTRACIVDLGGYVNIGNITAPAFVSDNTQNYIQPANPIAGSLATSTAPSNNFINGNLVVAVTSERFTPSSGDTLSPRSWTTIVVAVPAAGIAVLTVNMPPQDTSNNFNSPIFEFTTSQAITSITFATTDGSTIHSSPTTLTANTGARWIFMNDIGQAIWYQLP